MPITTKFKALLTLVMISGILLSAYAANAATANYTYDELDRLITATYDDGTIITYNYDELGNRLSTSCSGANCSQTLSTLVTGSGSISPASPTVKNGTDQTFTMTPNTCYYISDIQVDGVSKGTITSYTFTNVTATHTILANFAPYTYPITVSAGSGGTIAPGTTSVNCGGGQTFRITPNAGYKVASVSVDGVSQGALSSYTFSNVTATHSISAAFGTQIFTLTATAGSGGTISPASAQVSTGGSKTFTITPNAGYNVANVLVDGVSKGAINSYTFSNVTASHTISATFVAAYTLTATAGSGGTITPASAKVNSGGSQTFTITPNAGYTVVKVLVDGVSKGAITSYTFSNVTAPHTISATFAIVANYTITATAGSGGTITPASAQVSSGGSKTFTITSNAGYYVAKVLVDGVSKGAINS